MAAEADIRNDLTDIDTGRSKRELQWYGNTGSWVPTHVEILTIGAESLWVSAFRRLDTLPAAALTIRSGDTNTRPRPSLWVTCVESTGQRGLRVATEARLARGVCQAGTAYAMGGVNRGVVSAEHL